MMRSFLGKYQKKIREEGRERDNEKGRIRKIRERERERKRVIRKERR